MQFLTEAFSLLLTRDSSDKYCCGVHSYSQKVTGSAGIGCSLISFRGVPKIIFIFARRCRIFNSFRRLQSVMNAAARLIYGLRHSDHISDALISLHWLRAQERVAPTFQDGRDHVQGQSWNCAVIPESTGSCRRSAWSTFPPLCSDQSSAGTVLETVYRRRPGLPGRRTHHLEQSAGQRDISPVSVNLPSASKNISVPGRIA